MAATPERVIFYRDERGREPFTEWHSSVGDSVARKRILARINRLRTGNFGDCESVGGGILELRVDYGPGYRVYCARDGQMVVVLLCGGAKNRQQADIETAKTLWRQYRNAR